MRGTGKAAVCETFPPSSPTRWSKPKAPSPVGCSSVKLRDARCCVADMVIVFSEKDFILVTHLGRVDFLARAGQSDVSVAVDNMLRKQNAVLGLSGCSDADFGKIWSFSLRQ